MNSVTDKKLLIMGASSETIVTVQTANNMGLKVIAVDPVPGSPAKKYAWKSFDTDAMDVDALEKICIFEQVDGVMLGLSDRLLSPYFQLCARLKLPCYCTMKQIYVFCDKIRYKNKLREYGIPVIRDYAPDETLPYPVLVKPADASGSKGISVCRGPEELDTAIERAKHFSNTGRYLVEDYLECAEITANYTILEGEPFLALINDRYVVRSQEGFGSVANATAYPSKYAKLYLDTVHEKMCRLIRDMGFYNGTLNLQAFVDGDQIRFYDPAIRIGGGRSYLLSEYFNGTNIQEMLLRFAVTGNMLPEGTQCTLTKNDWQLNGMAALQPNLLVRTGTIGKIDGLDDLSDIPELVFLNQTHFAGDTITLEGTSQQTAIRMFFAAEDAEKVACAYEQVLSRIRITDVNGENMLLPPFDYCAHLDEYRKV